MKFNPKGKMVVFTAPSGAGKTTLVRHLLDHFGYLDFSVSATTRSRREHEREGIDYFFYRKPSSSKRLKKLLLLNGKKYTTVNFMVH